MMRMIFLTGAAFGLALLSSPAMSEPPVAGQFVDQCEQADPSVHNGCMQYIEGVREGYMLGEQHGAATMFCGPQDGDAEDWLRHVLRFVGRHPEMRGAPTGEAVVRAFAERWRC